VCVCVCACACVCVCVQLAACMRCAVCCMSFGAWCDVVCGGTWCTCKRVCTVYYVRELIGRIEVRLGCHLGSPVENIHIEVDI
jgi:hypothetical protein